MYVNTQGCRAIQPRHGYRLHGLSSYYAYMVCMIIDNTIQKGGGVSRHPRLTASAKIERGPVAPLDRVLALARQRLRLSTRALRVYVMKV